MAKKRKKPQVSESAVQTTNFKEAAAERKTQRAAA